MTDPRKTIYETLSELTSDFPTLKVFQQRPETIEVFPCITFNVESNIPTYNLSKDIANQVIVIKLDIWSESSNNGKDVLIAVEEKMREIDYRLTFNLDILDPSGIFHITTQFTY